MTVKKGYYLYAILAEKEPQNFGPIGIGGKGEKVYTLHYKDLAMAVSKAPVKTYDPVRKNAMAHQKVISTIMQRYDVLPVSFGTCVDSYEEVMNIFEKLYGQALSALDKIKNKIEVGLRVFWKKESFIREVGSANREVEALKEKIAGRDSDVSSYKQILELGERLQLIADNKRREYVNLLFEPLCNIASDAKLNDPTSEKMIINATFLVDKDKEEEFDRAVNKLYNAYCKDLDVKYTGPWPPYSFVGIKISRKE
ncbi:GvpL/GvpF family gas vesicle protein [Desulfoscipio geothermicus]|uniref:Gas vesicle synthesis protein GvpL/GvpF n=1 Tax=Desulfoscipio geothermicus DSM 3669 TaxID=1121426 RepID=A0A1I6CZU6_9FIRM|nr:GvpL/GvpF family gas vesicle protein [Desulfoscipio geothermicus]SFQ98577.1 Gas vesicle synthesis protein GvpL/GvpF [Desulfoscipio geothermicus DSM 3669]